MQKIYRVGIIGLGVGFKHFMAFQKLKNIKVTAVCDYDKKKIFRSKK